MLGYIRFCKNTSTVGAEKAILFLFGFGEIEFCILLRYTYFLINVFIWFNTIYFPALFNMTLTETS
jgi:hypothetical protein